MGATSFIYSEGDFFLLYSIFNISLKVFYSLLMHRVLSLFLAAFVPAFILVNACVIMQGRLEGKAAKAFSLCPN